MEEECEHPLIFDRYMNIKYMESSKKYKFRSTNPLLLRVPDRFVQLITMIWI